MISIDIPDKNMDNPLPDIIELVAVARAPFIDFTSLASIFEEHYVCETLEDMDCPCDIHNHNIFIKSENKFLFANTCLGTPNVARLKLYNPGLIPCELNSQTRQTPSPSAKALVSSSSKSSEPAFTVKPTKLCIAPYSTEFLEVTFLPPQIGIFNGIVEMNLESSTQKECKFVLQLAGEGCVPIVTIIEPQQYASSESSDLIFFPTLLGKKSTQKLKLKNTGSISCYVRLDLNEMDKSMFGIIGNEKTLPLIINESPEVTSLPRNIPICLIPIASVQSFISLA
ncbi:Uncharacterized protein GBIM_02868 [Gryllus bimaculatus]|nr:Uncharacterized protein GBIM_02868 [Gryllus bimaculatus]